MARQLHEIDPSAEPQARETPEQTPFALFWRAFKRNRLAVAALIIMLFLCVAAVFAPYLAPYDPIDNDILNLNQPPSGEHWLGTDQQGRDVVSRLLYGGRISLSVGIVAVGIALAIGLTLGSIAGFFGGIVDDLIMRLVDIVLSFPQLLLLIIAAAILGPSIWNTMVVIGIFSWTGVARLVRGEILSLRERTFVEAARAGGAGRARIIFKYLLPNAMAPVIVAATLGVAAAILAEANLSFLGLGVAPPTPSWGNMLQTALSMRVLEFYWWRWLPPGILIFLAVISINLIGDALQDALDPKALSD